MTVTNIIKSYSAAHRRAGDFKTEVFWLGIFLIILQIADCIYTLMGVQMHGLELEGNSLLRSYMMIYGPFATLVVAKTISIVLIVGLTAIAHKMLWIRSVLGGLSFVYLFAAIFPWVYILSA